MVVTQYNATTGQPNASFGSGGAVVHSFGFDSSLSAAAVQNDGKTVGAGKAPAVVNSVQGIGMIRVSGPTATVFNPNKIQVTNFNPVIASFRLSIDEPLFGPIPAVLCASSGSIMLVSGSRCGIVTIPTGANSVIVQIRVPVFVGPGFSETATLTVFSTNGLAESATQGIGTVTIEHLPSPQPYPGYRMVAADGGIFTFAAPFRGSAGGFPLVSPIVAMAFQPQTAGYWMAARDGGVFAFGAPWYGSAAGFHLTRPIVGMAATPTGHGYWLVASDGGIFGFGDARFFGSTGGRALTQPIVGMAATPDGRGYWLAARDGGIFAFGDAQFKGSTGGQRLAAPIVGIAAYPGAPGYWLVASDGGIFTFGAAGFHGSAGGFRLTRPIVGMAARGNGQGYWMVASDGGIFAFNAPFYGSMGGHFLVSPIVGISA
jgi:hypothetical protein